MPSWKKVIISGSDAALNSLNVTNGTTISSSLNLTGSFNITGSIQSPNWINFKSGSDQPQAEGRLGWDDGYGTLNIGLKGGNVNLAIGQEQVARVYNADSVPLTDGMLVYISGSQGNRVAVKRASAAAELGSANTLGMVTEPIAVGAEGFITTQGVVNGLNTTGLTAGALLYLSNSAGQYTMTRPTAPAHTVVIGYVERVHATVGSIYVKVDNGYEIGELHDVLDSTTSTSFGDLLVKSGSVWTNSRQLTGSYGLTGSLQATSFTGSLLGNATTATSASFASTASFVNTLNQNVIITGSLTTGNLTIGQGIVSQSIYLNIQNPGIGYGNGFNFQRGTDGAGINVIETGVDSTMYELWMSDNPDGGDMIQIRVSDYQSPNGLTVPIQTSGKTNRYVSDTHSFWGGISQNTSAFFTTSTFGGTNGSNNQLSINNISRLRTSGTTVNISTFNVTNYTGNSGALFWIRLDSSTTFAWGYGSPAGTAVQTGISLSTNPTPLSNGIQVAFTSTSGTLGDTFAARVYTSPINTLGSLVVTGSVQSVGGFTGSLSGNATTATSASFASTATSASYAVSASFAQFAATPTVQGIQGTIGSQGTTGAQGTTGIGTQGTQGTTGTSIQGAQGIQGRQGTTGTGTQGTQGTQGTIGSQGTTGTSIQGTQGTTGAQGTQGTSIQGIQGIQGIIGSQGTTGTSIQGTQGTIGSQGTTGTSIQGTQGTIGSQGTTGTSIQGTQGITGAQGTTGTSIQGIQGIQGRQGTTGTGTQGTQGTQGTIGSQGTTGTSIQGTQGTTGAQGTTGTSIQGTQGIQGTTGVQGTTGTSIQGTQGIIGSQGTTGTSIQGTQGITGAQGTTGASAGITSYTNAADNRVITSVNSSTINAESNLTFDGSTLTINGNLNAYAGEINVNRINFKNTAGSSLSDPYCLRWIDESSTRGNGLSWLEFQLNDDNNEEIRIYGNSCLNYNCGAISDNLYHRFRSDGYAWHAGTLQADGDARAPIFYDSNNTGYYIDPASTSVLNALTVGGSSVVTNNGGTWGINITGNAATATTLQTARTLTIGATGKTFNGSSNVSWTLAEIGAQAALTNPITGTATSGQVAFFNGTTTQTGDTNLFWDNTNKRLGIGTTSPGYKLDVNGDTNINGTLTATVKSFIIDHPTKPNKKLQYGVLEGPEHSVYVRGKLTNSRIITLPDHWHALVHEDTITVNLTPIGKKQDLWVETVSDTTITVGSDNEINCFYTVFAERKDIEKLVTEFDK